MWGGTGYAESAAAQPWGRPSKPKLSAEAKRRIKRMDRRLAADRAALLLEEEETRQRRRCAKCGARVRSEEAVRSGLCVACTAALALRRARQRLALATALLPGDGAGGCWGALAPDLHQSIGELLPAPPRPGLRWARGVAVTSVAGCLTRLECNAAVPADAEHVYVYAHGFPDSAVVPGALEWRDAPEGFEGSEEAEGGLEGGLPQHRLHSARTPRKFCDQRLKKHSGAGGAGGAAFVSFNTRGVPGSEGRFEDKTLTADLADLDALVRFSARCFPKAAINLIGLSTGAILCVLWAGRWDDLMLVEAEAEGRVASGGAEETRKERRRKEQERREPPPNVVSVTALACVSEPCDSFGEEFDAAQLQGFAEDGHCAQQWWDFGALEPVLRRLNVGYLESYAMLERMEDVLPRLAERGCTLLCLHGDDDPHVPVRHAEAIRELALRLGLGLEGSGRGAVKVVVVKRGGHMFSSSKAMKAALRAEI